MISRLLSCLIVELAFLPAACATRVGAGGRNRSRASLAQLGGTGVFVTALRDALLDAVRAVPEEARKRISASSATLTSDELIDLLAMSVQG